MAELETVRAAGLPVLLARPPADLDRRRLVIWLPGLTGTKEDHAETLDWFASRGSTAIGLDPYAHGERGVEARSELGRRVFASFRASMWRILGETVLDVATLVDWARRELVQTRSVGVGGTSMGGDIAVASAGLDARIDHVAAAVATPDWTRPGMEIDGAVVNQGTPDVASEFLYRQLDPITHPFNYRRRCPILFECGAEDRHVPPEAALRFQATLSSLDPGADPNVEVRLHEGVAHAVTAEILEGCRLWLDSDHDT